MKNNIFLALLAIAMSVVLVCVAPVDEGQNKKSETESTTVQEEATAEPVDIVIVQELDEETIIKNKLCKLENISDKKEKLLLYKSILNAHSNIVDEQETIYELFGKNEVNLLHKVVQAEIGGGDFDAKVNVANVILNRVFYEGFGNSLSEVLNENQFSTIKNGSYNNVKISEETILACEYAALFEDTVDGALYFESMNSNVHENYAEFVFDDGYHKFYR